MVVPYLLCSISLVFAKIFVTVQANYGRIEERESSFVLHLFDNAMFIPILAYFLFRMTKEPFVQINAMAIFFGCFYGSALLLAPISGIPLISAYHAIRGLFSASMEMTVASPFRWQDRLAVSY